MWWLLTFAMGNTETNNNIFRKFKYKILEDDFSVRYMLHYLAAYFGYVRGVRWQCLCAIIMLIISCTFVLKQMKAILVKPWQKSGTRGYAQRKCKEKMQWLLDFSVTIRYVLLTRLKKAEMQWLLDFSVTIRYVLPTRLPKAKMQWLLDFSVPIRYVLATRLQRAEMQWLLDFSVTIRYVLPTRLQRPKWRDY